MANVHPYMGYFIMLIFCPYVFAIETGKRGSHSEHHGVNVNNTKLRLVSMVFRHGDRTVDDYSTAIYPSDPCKNQNEYPNNNGLLTNVGKRRAFQLGRTLKKTYDYFLGDVYYPPNVYARSSAVPRTKMTLQLVLAALYPPIDCQMWNKKLDWQPTNMIYTDISKDGLLMPYYCEKYEQAYVNILNNRKVIMEINSFNNLMKNLSESVGRNITSIYELYILYHNLLVQSSMGLILPDWTRDIFPYGELYDAALFQYKLYNYNNELIKLNGGMLLYKIIEDIHGIINGTLTDRKINLFSAHDINVVAVLYALGIYDNSLPAFTSGVIIELHEKNDKYFIRVLRYLGIPSTLAEVTIPGCNKLCPLEKFIRLRLQTIAMCEDPNCPLTIPMV